MMGSRFTLAGRVVAGMVVVIFIAAYLFQNTIMALAGSAILLYLTYRRMEFHSLIRRIDLEIERIVLEGVMYKDSVSSIRLTVISKESVKVRIWENLHRTLMFKDGNIDISGTVHLKKPISMIYSVIPKERGYIRFPPVNITLYEGRGLFETDRVMDTGTEILIRASKKDIAMAKLMSRKKQFDITGPANKRHTRTHRADFRSIRDYMPGDSFRDIDWKAMSRLTKLMTKEFEQETNLPTMILLDTSISMREMVRQRSKMDHGIALALQISVVMDANSHPVGLISFDDNKVCEHLSPGKWTIDDIVMTLFRSPSPVETGRYPGLPEVYSQGSSEGEDTFLSRVGPFMVKGMRSTFSREKTTGVYEAFRALELSEESGLLLIIISDLETNRPSFMKSIRMAMKRNHRIVLVSPFSWPYHVGADDVGVEELENIYEDYLGKQTLLRSLRSGGVKVIDVSHLERGESVISGIRRMSK